MAVRRITMTQQENSNCWLHMVKSSPNVICLMRAQALRHGYGSADWKVKFLGNLWTITCGCVTLFELFYALNLSYPLAMKCKVMLWPKVQAHKTKSALTFMAGFALLVISIKFAMYALNLGSLWKKILDSIAMLMWYSNISRCFQDALTFPFYLVQYWMTSCVVTILWSIILPIFKTC